MMDSQNGLSNLCLKRNQNNLLTTKNTRRNWKRLRYSQLYFILVSELDIIGYCNVMGDAIRSLNRIFRMSNIYCCLSMNIKKYI